MKPSEHYLDTSGQTQPQRPGLLEHSVCITKGFHPLLPVFLSWFCSDNKAEVISKAALRSREYLTQR